MEEWAPLFNEALLQTAATDPLLHHAQVVEMVGDSYRNPPKGKLMASRTTSRKATNSDA